MGGKAVSRKNKRTTWPPRWQPYPSCKGKMYVKEQALIKSAMYHAWVTSPAYECKKCGQQVFTDAQAVEYDKRLSEALRLKEAKL